MKGRLFSSYLLFLLLSACGGGSSEETQVITEPAPNPPTNVNFTASLSEVDWQQGTSFDQCVEVNSSLEKTDYELLFGPAGMSINSKGCLNWSGTVVDFGQNYTINYSVLVTRTGVMKTLTSNVNVESKKTFLQHPISFFQQKDFGLLSHEGFFKTIRTPEKAEYALVNREVDQYSIVRLTEELDLVLEKIAPNLSKNQHIIDWGDFDNGQGLDLLIKDSERGYYRLHTPDIVYSGSIDERMIALVDIVGEQDNEVLIAERTTRDVDPIDFKFYQGDNLVHQLQTASTHLNRVCDVDGDGIKEVNANGKISSSTLNISTDIVSYSDFIFDRNSNLCSSFISFPNDSSFPLQYIKWYEVNSGERNLVTNELISKSSENVILNDVFIGTLSYGENPTLIYNDTKSIVSLIGYVEGSDVNAYSKYRSAVAINFDLTNEQISTHALTFSMNLGIKISQEDRVIGVADLDNDGSDELIYEHFLTSTDTGYFNFTSQSNSLGARVLVAAKINDFNIMPVYISKILPFGNDNSLKYQTNVQFTERGELKIQQESSQVVFDKSLNIVSSTISAETFARNECLAWDNECVTEVKLDQESRTLSIIDKVSQQVILVINDLPIQSESTWASYVDEKGAKSFVLANSYEIYLFSF